MLSAPSLQLAPAADAPARLAGDVCRTTGCVSVSVTLGFCPSCLDDYDARQAAVADRLEPMASALLFQLPNPYGALSLGCRREIARRAARHAIQDRAAPGAALRQCWLDAAVRDLTEDIVCEVRSTNDQRAGAGLH